MMTKHIFIIACFFLGFSVQAQEEQNTEEETEQEGQSRDSQAMDATATQWSFQAAYQSMPDYFDDIVNGGTTKSRA